MSCFVSSVMQIPGLTKNAYHAILITGKFLVIQFHTYKKLYEISIINFLIASTLLGFERICFRILFSSFEKNATNSFEVSKNWFAKNFEKNYPLWRKCLSYNFHIWKIIYIYIYLILSQFFSVTNLFNCSQKLQKMFSFQFLLFFENKWKLYYKHFLHTLDVWNCMIMIFVVWNCMTSIFGVCRSTRVDTIFLYRLPLVDVLQGYVGTPGCTVAEVWTGVHSQLELPEEGHCNVPPVHVHETNRTQEELPRSFSSPPVRQPCFDFVNLYDNKLILK